MQSKQSKMYSYFSPAKAGGSAPAQEKRQRYSEEPEAPDAKRNRVGVFPL